MALTKEQILTTLNLPDFGRQQALGLIRYSSKTNTSITTDKELMELIDAAFNDGFLKDIPEYYLSDFTKCRAKAERILENCAEQRIDITMYGDEDFPKQFHSLISRGKETCPVLLYYRGDVKKVCSLPGIAVIGTRRVTKEGYADGEYLSRSLAQKDCNIISGLAVGADTAAHNGALMAKGVTTAITAFGLGVTPSNNAYLLRQIVAEEGLLLSEYAPGVQENSATLVERDRLQAGLADVVLLVQSDDKKGGSMHAVRTAIENRKPVFAIDYRSTRLAGHPMVQGNIRLIEEGKAIPVDRLSVQKIRKLLRDE
jgi:DNA processing protein